MSRATEILPHFIGAVCISRGTIDATRQPVRVGGERLVSFLVIRGTQVGHSVDCKGLDCKGLIAPLEE